MSDLSTQRPGLVELRFLPADRPVWVRPDTGLVAAAELAGVEIVTGCTRGQCGTDPVRIVRAEPDGALGEPGEVERATLERMGLEPGDGWRLACSTRAVRGAAVVDLAAF